MELLKFSEQGGVNVEDMECDNCRFDWIKFLKCPLRKVNKDGQCQVCICTKREQAKILEEFKDKIPGFVNFACVRDKKLWYKSYQKKLSCCYCKYKSDEYETEETCKECLIYYYAFAPYSDHVICKYCYDKKSSKIHPGNDCDCGLERYLEKIWKNLTPEQRKEYSI